MFKINDLVLIIGQPSYIKDNYIGRVGRIEVIGDMYYTIIINAMHDGNIITKILWLIDDHVIKIS